MNKTPSRQTTTQRESESRKGWNRALLEVCTDTFFVLAGDGTVLDYIPGMDGQRLLPQLRRDQIVGRRAAEILPATVAAELTSAIDQALKAGGGGAFEFSIPGPDADRHFELRYGPGGEDEVLVVMREITEQRHIDELIGMAHDRLQIIMDTATDAIYLKDSELRFTHLNAAGAKILGIARPADAIGKTDLEFFDAEFAEARMREERRILETGKPLSNSEEMLEVDGTMTYRLASKVPISGSDGAPVGIVGIVRDITELKKTQIALVSGEKRFRALIENAADSISILDLEGYLRYMSPALASTFGEIPSGVIGKHSSEYQHSDDLSRSDEVWRRCLQNPGAVIVHEYRRRASDGSWRRIMSNVKYVPDFPDGPRVIVNSQDVTEQRLAEEQLRQSEERYELAVAGSNDGIWDVDLITGRTNRSDRWAEILGYQPEEAPDLAIESLVHKDDLKAQSGAWESHLKGRTPFYSADFGLKTKSGEYRWVRSRGQAIRHGNGDPVRMAGS